MFYQKGKSEEKVKENGFKNKINTGMSVYADSHGRSLATKFEQIHREFIGSDWISDAQCACFNQAAETAIHSVSKDDVIVLIGKNLHTVPLIKKNTT